MRKDLDLADEIHEIQSALALVRTALNDSGQFDIRSREINGMQAALGKSIERLEAVKLAVHSSN